MFKKDDTEKTSLSDDGKIIDESDAVRLAGWHRTRINEGEDRFPHWQTCDFCQRRSFPFRWQESLFTVGNSWSFYQNRPRKVALMSISIWLPMGSSQNNLRNDGPTMLSSPLHFSFSRFLSLNLKLLGIIIVEQYPTTLCRTLLPTTNRRRNKLWSPCSKLPIVLTHEVFCVF